jgi:hypothetical protein
MTQEHTEERRGSAHLPSSESYLGHQTHAGSVSDRHSGRSVLATPSLTDSVTH